MALNFRRGVSNLAKMFCNSKKINLITSGQFANKPVRKTKFFTSDRPIHEDSRDFSGMQKNTIMPGVTYILPSSMPMLAFFCCPFVRNTNKNIPVVTDKSINSCK